MNLQIRLATKDDIVSLQKLIHDSVRGLSTEHYSAEQIANALQHVFGVDTQLIEDKTYFVAEVENYIVGSGGWSKRKTLYGGDQTKSQKIDDLLDAASDPARIRAFYVHPDWARKGIASRILAACEEAARQAGFTQLELAATLPGEPLYSAMGYEKAEPIDIRITGVETLPGFLMKKRLRETDAD